MAKTVVDHLEAIEIQEENREALARAPPLVLLEPAAEDFEEVGAVAQPRQRVAEADGAQTLPVDDVIGDVRDRPRNPKAEPAAADGHPAAQNPAVGAGLVANQLVVLDGLRFARAVRLDGVF